MQGVTFDLDRASPVPLYYQVARCLEDAIERGDLGQGDRIDNETDLAQRLGISRPTVNRAIQELVNKGMVVRRRGVGTQVIGNAVRRPLRLTSLYDDLQRSGQEPSTEVLKLEVGQATEEKIERLGLEPGQKVVAIERRRSAGGRAIALMRNWLPATVAGDLTISALESGGLYAYLRTKGVRPHLAEQRIGATAATEEEAARLGVEVGAPLLTMERTAYDDTGSVLEFGSHVYDAGNYSYSMTLLEN
ncbi:GntR family transcriptional regulator [Nitriliruptor alkaliphilus]|uniref:GntR family transcriptional regulator n=1 Tax=Nitriliruptor alkaliphilus TaxID=427918 RepID=UPI0006963001|nr:GntR family transcriptional regulator [Nitriliruptor alkaliphilus]